MGTSSSPAGAKQKKGSMVFMFLIRALPFLLSCLDASSRKKGKRKKKSGSPTQAVPDPELLQLDIEHSACMHGCCMSTTVPNSEDHACTNMTVILMHTAMLAVSRHRATSGPG
jgi:hypothetical protein